MKRRFAIFGAVTILFWLSLSVYFFRYNIGLWLQVDPLSFWREVALIIAGVFSGVLLLVHPRSGRILALALCLAMLILRISHTLSAYPHILRNLHATYFIMLPQMPIYTIHHEIIALAFFITTVLYLGRKSIA
jgi:hypothetical protein